MSNGRVIAGAFKDASVSKSSFGNSLVVSAGLLGRKLNAENVASWQEQARKVPSRGAANAVSAIGRAVTDAALPRFISGRAARSVGAAIDTVAQAVPTRSMPHEVLVTWADGRESLLELPEDQFVHLGLMLREQRLERDPAVVEAEAAALEAAELEVATAKGQSQDASSTAVDHAFGLVSGFVTAHQESQRSIADTAAADAARSRTMEQLAQLGKLHDAGVLTDEEFSAKKSELLGRL